MFSSRSAVLMRVVSTVAAVMAVGILGPMAVRLVTDRGGSAGVFSLIAPPALVYVISLAVMSWTRRLEVTAEGMLRVRSLVAWNSVDLNTMFEVRHFTERRRRRSGSQIRGDRLVDMVGVKDNAGNTVKLALAEWAKSDELVLLLHRAAAERHVPVIREGELRREGEGIAQPLAGPSASGGGVGFGRVHAEDEPLS